MSEVNAKNEPLVEYTMEIDQSPDDLNDVVTKQMLDEAPGFTNILIAENQHYKELAEWFEAMSVVEFALWKLLKLVHSY